MKRLHLTVEGQTEAAFATSVLGPHLESFNVFLHKPRFTGSHQRRRGRIPKGGLLNTFNHALSDMRVWLKTETSPEVRFSMMIDLYSLPHDFPGYADGLSKPTGSLQAAALEQSLATAIGDARVIPYLQVHEFEALVLSDPGRIKTIYEVRAGALEALVNDCSRFESPEEINHGQQSHPKYRIKNAVPDYDENVAGPLLTESIGLQALRTSCPHFGEWLTRLEQLDAEVPHQRP